jgi:hypothetical protein
LIINDLNGKVAGVDPQLLIHIGDIAYAVGYAAQWDQFFDQVQPIASRIPYHVCIGNHERDFPKSNGFYNGTDSGGECGVPYEKRFHAPTPGLDKPWYSFDFGNIHFTFMSTEHDFRKGTAQNAWLERDLATVNRTNTPWLIFSGHRPMYIDSTSDSGAGGDLPVSALLRESLEEYLLKYQVDLAWWGHHHSYQRTCPVYNEKCVAENPKGYTAPVHVVIGMAGMGLSTNIKAEKPDWIEFVDVKEYGYSRVHSTPTTLHMEFVSDINGAIKDQFTLSKK